MQGKHTSKMSLRFAFTLLLTLQSLQLGSTQTINLWDEEVTPSPSEGIPPEWKRADSLILPKNDVATAVTFSGDGEVQSVNQPVTAETGQYDKNVTTNSSTQTTVISISINTVENNQTKQNNMSVLITPDPSLQPSTTRGSNVNLTVTNSTTPSPGKSNTTTITTSNTISTTVSTPAINITQNSTTTVSMTTTTPKQFANITEPPSNNSTNTADSTTISLQNYTSVDVFNESSTVSTTKINATGEPFRENVDRGSSLDVAQQTKSQAWGAVLGIGVGVAIVGLVVYIIVKRRNYRDFSHRKLVEDAPPEPVLRLDNSEPLDLKYGGLAYYNPGLQGDNIQMTNFPQGQPH